MYVYILIMPGREHDLLLLIRVIIFVRRDKVDFIRILNLHRLCTRTQHFKVVRMFDFQANEDGRSKLQLHHSQVVHFTKSYSSTRTRTAPSQYVISRMRKGKGTYFGVWRIFAF